MIQVSSVMHVIPIIIASNPAPIRQVYQNLNYMGNIIFNLSGLIALRHCFIIRKYFNYVGSLEYHS